MSLRAKILLVALVSAAILVSAFAAIQLNTMVSTTVESANRLVALAAQQTTNMLLFRAQDLWAPAGGDRKAWQAAIAADQRLASFLTQSVAAAPVLLEISIAGANARILTSSTLAMTDAPLRERPSLALLTAMGPLDRALTILFSPGAAYEFRVPIGNIAEAARPDFTVQVLVSTALLKDPIQQGLFTLATISLVAFVVAGVLVWVLARFLARNVQHIGDAVDRIQHGQALGAVPEAMAPEFRAVESKLSLLGAQVRSAADFRSRVSAVLERLEEGILLYDADRRLSLAGGAAGRLLGRPPEEIQPLASFVQTAFDQKGSIPEYVLDWPHNGGTVRLLASADYFADSGSLLVRLRDAEGRRQLESQMDLLARLDAINRLTGGVAHEIKNPLNSIAARLALLETMVENSAEAEEEIRVIGEEVERLDRVVRTFLDFTRPVELARDEVDLVALAREVAEFVEPQATAAGVVVKFNSSVDTCLVRGDANLLHQAVVNLVVNGIEAMPQGGTLSIDVDRNRRLTIADTGVGIPEAQRQKIFQLYYTTKKGGSGIGLAMVYRAVQLHGGSIEVESEPGQGTRFRLEFPS